MTIKKTKAASFSVYLDQLIKKYQKINKQIIFNFVFHYSQKVKSWLDYTKYRNDPIDFIPRKLSQAIVAYQNGKPWEIIVGNEIKFYQTKIKVLPSVFIPRIETEWLVAKAITLIRRYQYEQIADVCCGTGAIGLNILQQLPSAKMHFIDLNPLCIKNVKLNLQLNQINQKRCHLVVDDFIHALNNTRQRLQVICCNPPYVDPKVLDQKMVKYESKIAFANHDNPLYFYQQIMKNISKIMADNFLIIFEIGYDQKRGLTELLKKYKLSNYATFEKDLAGHDRILIIDSKKPHNWLRQRLITKLRIGIKNKTKRDQLINQQLMDAVKKQIFSTNDFIALYSAQSIEPDLTPLIKFCFDHQIRVCIPCFDDRTMWFREIKSLRFPNIIVNHIKQPTTGLIIQPKQIKVLVAPCIGYFHNHRLGYGRNYYQNYLTKIRHKLLTLLVAYREQQHDFNSKNRFTFDQTITK